MSFITMLFGITYHLQHLIMMPLLLLGVFHLLVRSKYCPTRGIKNIGDCTSVNFSFWLTSHRAQNSSCQQVSWKWPHLNNYKIISWNLPILWSIFIVAMSKRTRWKWQIWILKPQWCPHSPEASPPRRFTANPQQADLEYRCPGVSWGQTPHLGRVQGLFFIYGCTNAMYSVID